MAAALIRHRWWKACQKLQKWKAVVDGWYFVDFTLQICSLIDFVFPFCDLRVESWQCRVGSLSKIDSYVYTSLHLILYLTWVNKYSPSPLLCLSDISHARPCRKFIVTWVTMGPTLVNNRRRQNSPMTRRISSRVYTNRLRKYTRTKLSRTLESRRNPRAGILIDRLTGPRTAARRGYSNPISLSSLEHFLPEWTRESARRHAAVMSIFAQLTDEIGLTFLALPSHMPYGTIFPRPRILSRRCKRSTWRSPRHRHGAARRRGDNKRCIFSRTYPHDVITSLRICLLRNPEDL